MAQKPEQRTCFSVSGSRTKTGKPCGFVIPEPLKFCQHHDPDRARQKEILTKAKLACQEIGIPHLDVDITTLEGCLQLRNDLAKFLIETKRPDYRRVEALSKLTSGASQDLANYELRRQNDLLLQLDGFGNGLVLRDRLMNAPLHKLPGLPGRRKALDLAEVLKPKESVDTAPFPSTKDEQEA